mmetsp:Transcript_4183/g.10589  ORF Transcript_4183/g.10589 Transcript_4183/m.10589 type:complete len:266 (+) Transcript_4183:138-935(+)
MSQNGNQKRPSSHPIFLTVQTLGGDRRRVAVRARACATEVRQEVCASIGVSPNDVAMVVAGEVLGGSGSKGALDAAMHGALINVVAQCRSGLRLGAGAGAAVRQGPPLALQSADDVEAFIKAVQNMGEAGRSAHVNVVVGYTPTGAPIRRRLTLASLASSLSHAEASRAAAAASEAGGGPKGRETTAKGGGANPAVAIMSSRSARKRLEALTAAFRDRQRKRVVASTICGKLRQIRERRAAKAARRRQVAGQRWPQQPSVVGVKE